MEDEKNVENRQKEVIEKEIIDLKGGKIHITRDNQYYYHLVSGKVIIYMAIEQDGLTGRRHYLAEADGQEKDMIIPSLNGEEEEGEKWVFVFSAVGNALLERIPYEEEEKKEKILFSFALEMNIKLYRKEDFYQEVVEKIQRKLVAEELSIYRNQSEYEKLSREGLSSIADVFRKGNSIEKNKKTKNKLYNTVAFLCEKKGIKIASYEAIVESCTRRFTLQDIARVSHFMIREVKLDEKWYRQESGYLLIYKETREEEQYIPVACVPEGKNRYKEYDLEERKAKYIDEKANEKYLKTAYMFYRPLPDGNLGFMDLIKFGVGEIDKRDIIYTLFFTLLGTLIGLLLPFINQVIYDEYIPFGKESLVLQIGLLVLAFHMGSLLFAITKNIAIYRVSVKMEYSVQSAVFDRLFNLKGNVYERNDSAILAKSAFHITEIFNLISEVVITTLLAALFSLIYLWRMYEYSASLAMTGLLMVGFQVLLLILIGLMQLKQEGVITDIAMKESSLIYQLIDGIAKIRIAGAKSSSLVKYIKLYTAHKKRVYIKDKLLSLSDNLNQVLSVTFTAIFYYMLVRKNLNLTFGNFMAFMSAFGMFSLAAEGVAVTFIKVNHLIPLFHKCKLILQNGKEYEEDLQMAGTIKGNIEVNNLSFAYNEKESNVISDISFKIESGEYIGIVGTSGSGKSSLLKLLLGFEKPNNGKIYYDEKDLDCLDKRELRKCFGVVLQEGRLISGSIYENIVLAGSALSQADKIREGEKVLKVIKEVGLEEDIANMPMGLQTIISEGAGNISGGQRQKILIARAIFHNPAILFFDEATSALDNRNQALVTGNLEKLKITRVVIAHRLSTVRNCDRIFVMDNGRLVEMGRYKELMEQKGYFYQLSHRQLA